MQIKINLKIFLFIIIFCITKQIEIYGIIMFFALIHEIAHLITGICLKLKPKSLSIMPFGLTVTFEDYDLLKIPIKRVIIALAGPAINILIAIILGVIAETKHMETVIYSNLLIGAFNLIPVYPLDGGQIVKNLIHIKYNLKIANKITLIISKTIVILLTFVSSIAILYFKNIAILVIIAYLWYLVIRETKTQELKNRVYEIMKKEAKQEKQSKNIDKSKIDC